jgi:hypothetical protein
LDPKEECLAGENVKARRAVGAGADRHVGDYERRAWSDERADIIVELRSFKFGTRRPLLAVEIHSRRPLESNDFNAVKA